MKRKKQRRCFFTSLFMTLLVFLLLTGFVMVDRNTRKVGFGEDTPFVSVLDGQTQGYGVEFNIFGKNYTIHLTP